MLPFGLDFTNPRLTPLDLATALSEQGVCLLTGERDGLVYIPVDGDPANVLPSNVACLSPAGMALSDPVRVAYSLPLTSESGSTILWGLDFESPYSFLGYNLSLTSVASVALASWSLDPEKPAQSLITVFTELVKLHFKGLKSVQCHATGLSLGWKSYQTHLIHKSREIKAGISPVRLVTV